MAIDFPASPTVGQTFTAGTITYTWDGTKWNASSFPSTFGLGTAASPSITFSGDTDTGLYSPGANQVAISTGGSGRLFVDANGRVLTGTSTALNANGTSDWQQQIAATGPVGILLSRFSNNTGPARINLLKSRSGTIGSNTIVSNGDVAGAISFLADDGTNYTGSVGEIKAEIDGVPGTGSLPGRIVFSTTPTGTNGSQERLRITSAGLVGIGTSSPARTLDVNGTARIADGSAIEWGGTSAFIAGTSTSNALQFFTASTERFRVDSTGNLTINSQGDLRFGDADNSNWVGFQAPATVASNVIWTLPAADGTASQVLGTNGSGVLSFLTAGASLNVAAKSANYTAVAADKSYLFTCTGSWTLSLTSAATLGNGWYIFLNNPGTGQITVDPDGTELIGGATTAVLNPGDLWLIACDGSNFVLNRLAGNNYQIFDSSGTFTVPAGVERIFVQAWGGGGGGGRGDTSGIASAGGGSGGYTAGWLNVSPTQAITATVGSGGSGGTTTNSSGGSGGNTTFSTLSAFGGSGSVASALFAASSTTAQGGDTGGSGEIQIKGQSGTAILLNSFSQFWISLGGNAPAGGTGGCVGHGSSVNGSVVTPSGRGGGGAGGCDTNPTRNGQTGAAGRIIVYWV